jgi:hypothetical protein
LWLASADFFLGLLLDPEVDAIRSLETLDWLRIKQLYKPEDNTLFSHCYENLEFHKIPFQLNKLIPLVKK